ncbi:MAG TPA: glycosyltransferase family 2 protein [Ktedonobacterales bacterium]|nr:glycosyltransferase family 2 protein [Ktedonobacterales bacterium]
MESHTPYLDTSNTAIPDTEEARAFPLVSLVIPSHNRRASLQMVLEGLDRQTILPEQFEVLVICDGCTDDTVAVCRSRATRYTLRIIEQTPNQGPAAARNRGVEAARASLILFIDDDVVPEPTLIAEHLRLHQTDERAVVIGPLLAPAGFRLNPWTGWEEAMLEKQYRAMSAHAWKPTPRQFYTGNASVRREHILQAGGFDASFRRAEDVELAFRFSDLGLRFYFNPDAKGWHHALRSLRSWLSIPTAYGQADVAMHRNGREVILRRMAKEFHLRQRPLQRLARLCVGRAWLLRPVVGGLLVTASFAAWTGQQKAAYGAYSAIFNLRYWQSVCEQLGGAPAFWALVQQYAGTPR